MSYKTFTVQSISSDPSRSLSSDVTIAFSIAAEKPTKLSGDRKDLLVAWKVLRFTAGSSDLRQLRLYPSRRIAMSEIQDEGQTSSKWVLVLDNGAGLGPNQHLAVSASGRWTSNVLYDMCPDASFVANKTSRTLTLSIGSRSPSNPFEAMAVLSGLAPQDSALVRYPFMMQAYDMTGVECNEGDILEGRGSYRLEDLALFRDADGRPTPIDTRVLREDVVFQIYSDAHGGVVLEQLVRPKKVPIPRPPPPPRVLIPAANLFGSAIQCSAPSRLQPRSPPSALSPGFNLDWTNPTPPRTPAIPLPPPPVSAVSPGFLSPIRTPIAESGGSFYVPSF